MILYALKCLIWFKFSHLATLKLNHKNSFLDQVAQAIHLQWPDKVDEVCIVLPTRRASIFLREALARVYKRTIWSPKIQSIQDFVREQSGWQFPEPLALVFELYQVYQGRMRQDRPDWKEPLERFFPWGEMLLKDFDEVDKYMVEAENLFTNILDLKRVEHEFGISEDDKKALANFWRSVHGETGQVEQPSEVKQLFLDIWEILYEVYQGLIDRLRARNQGYDGMAYRELVTQLESGTRVLPYQHIYFVGFNALSGAEYRMIDHLLDAEQATIFWDMEESFRMPQQGEPFYRARLSAIGEEAGKFIRQYHKDWKNKGSKLIVHDMNAAHKDVYLTAVPVQVGQAQYVGQLLAQKHPPSEALRQHAVVLADENLLFPVLYSLPHAVDKLNITMGYPLRQTTIYHLLMSITDMLRKQVIEADEQLYFSHQELLTVLNNAYLKAAAPKLSEPLQAEIRKRNMVMVPATFLAEKPLPPLLAHIFEAPREAETALQYFDQLFDDLLADAQKRKVYLEAEYIFHLFTLYNRLKEVLDRYEGQMTLKGFAELFREVIKKGRIPFEGEPLQGLQLMGFLETRTLDFPYVYILGANEGNLPDTSSGNSFIPYHLRKGFRMPTFEEKDAIFAYHFYRLLQRAEEVHLIYNSNISDGGNSGEMSRYLQQLRHLAYLYPNVQLHERQASTGAPYFAQPPIEVHADTRTHGQLSQLYEADGVHQQPFLSATALTTYLACPLRFYYRYVAKIKEPETLEENMEANTFGTVLHAAMEFLYEPYVGKKVSPAVVESLKKQLDPHIKRAFEDSNLGWGERLHGKNYLYRDVIRKLCQQILKQDLALAEQQAFEVAHLEDGELFYTELPVDKKRIKLNGFFDRVDRVIDTGRIRIVDYKTGNVSFNKPYTVEQCFSPDEQPPSFKGLKEAFQGYLYAWLYNRQFPDTEIVVGYYTARKLSEGLVYLNEGAPIRQDELVSFEQHLTVLIQDIFEGDYRQTADEKKCGYCPYRGICNR